MPNNAPPACGEKLEASLLHAAFAELLLEEWNSVAAQEPTAEEKLLLQQVEADMPRRLEEIRKQVRQHQRHTRRPRRLSITLQAAIVVLLLLILSLAIAVAAKSAFGTPPPQLFVTIEDDHVNVSLVQPNGNLPDQPPWYEGHFPTYLPEEFPLFEEYHDTCGHTYNFFNAEYEWLSFKAASSGSVSGYSMNSGTSEAVRVNGTRGILLHTDREFIVAWSHDRAYFVVTAPTKELALRVANSVRPGIK